MIVNYLSLCRWSITAWNPHGRLTTWVKGLEFLSPVLLWRIHGDGGLVQVMGPSCAKPHGLGHDWCADSNKMDLTPGNQSPLHHVLLSSPKTSPPSSGLYLPCLWEAKRQPNTNKITIVSFRCYSYHPKKFHRSCIGFIFDRAQIHELSGFTTYYQSVLPSER
jgi:hypothetical protein